LHHPQARRAVERDWGARTMNHPRARAAGGTAHHETHMPAKHTEERPVDLAIASGIALVRARKASDAASVGALVRAREVFELGSGALVRARCAKRGSRGAVLVEFAMIAIAFYILMAGTIELGRMIFAEQILQNAARVGARELATLPLPPVISFTDALQNSDVKASIFDASLLAFEYTDDSTLQSQIDGWPVVNRMLAPLMVQDEVEVDGQTVKLFRYPGALLQNNDFGDGATNRFVVAIPQVDDAWTSIVWHPVVEEICQDGNPAYAPFSMSAVLLHTEERGEVALRINYPFQAATLVQYRGSAGVNNAVLADDHSFSMGAFPPGMNVSLANVQSTVNSIGSYSGSLGLGNLFAANSTNNPAKALRPFHRVLVAQSIFRREVFSAPLPPH
jgi:TadE-like protein